MPVVLVPKALRERLGDDATEGLVALLEKLHDETAQDALVLAEERFARRLAESQAQLQTHMAELERKLDKRITEEVAKLRTELASSRSEMIKWMFLFWVGQLAAIAALLNWLR